MLIRRASSGTGAATASASWGAAAAKSGVPAKGAPASIDASRIERVIIGTLRGGWWTRGGAAIAPDALAR